MEALIRRYENELFNFLCRFCGDRPTAEDVFQETFLQVHISAETFDLERRFKPWLFTIAANKARDFMRRKARRPAMPLDAPIGSGDDRQSFVDLLKADLPRPQDHLEENELKELVARTINQMPDALREILLLAYFQKLSYQEVAESLGIPLGTVKSRLHSAVATFAKCWQKQNLGIGPA